MPARGPVGIPPDGPVGTEGVDGVDGIDGDAGGGARLAVGLRETSSAGRVGAAPHVEELPKDPLPEPRPKYPPRTGAAYARGPVGGAEGPGISSLDDLTGATVEGIIGERAAGAKLRLGPDGGALFA
jgi:hypothetical protein